MDIENLSEELRAHSEPYKIVDGGSFRLADHDPGDTDSMPPGSKEMARETLERAVEALAEMQELLYAQDRWAVLLAFQAPDAAGKDSTIKAVMSGVNPQGCQVFSFKKPSSEELDHDFMWRCMKRLPERGRIGIFNRSYYEEVLVVKVHPELLEYQRLPRHLYSDEIWAQRYEDIRNIETFLSRNGVAICKFFLNVSKEEQKERFLKRLNRSDKHWKFSSGDLKERGYWDKYQAAYEKMIQETATPHAPWYVIPADHKWYTRVAVISAIIETMRGLDLRYPLVTDELKAEISHAREVLSREGS